MLRSIHHILDDSITTATTDAPNEEIASTLRDCRESVFPAAATRTTEQSRIKRGSRFLCSSKSLIANVKLTSKLKNPNTDIPIKPATKTFGPIVLRILDHFTIGAMFYPPNY